MNNATTSSVEVLRDIEAELSQPLFRGVPIGPALSSACIVEIRNRHGDWGLLARWKNRARQVKCFLLPGGGSENAPAIPRNRILVTWIYDNFRHNEMIRPVIEAIGPERCAVMGGSPSVLPLVPRGAFAVFWDQVMRFDAAAWRADYRKCRPEWHRRLRGVCHKHHLPRGVYDRFAFHLLIASRAVAGCLEFLKVARPAAVLTEYDRNDHWAPLVLSARLLGIPTFTMVHGVLNERAIGYVPVLADKVFCWGELQRRQFLAEGEDPEKVLVAGCPRLTRDLGVTQADGRRKLGLPVDKPVVMLGTTMVGENERRNMAELFCVAVGKIQGISSIVRLHPSEQLDTYAPLAKRYPQVRFHRNSDSTLDESLSAADIVVVPNSGLGSDALVKRRLTIVLDLQTLCLGHGLELIEKAGCPRAANAEELAAAVDRLLFNEEERERHFAMANEYVGEFCAAFGRDAARRIGDLVRNERATTATDNQESP